MVNCNRCGNEIEWLKMANGKSHPVDPKPVIIQSDRGEMEAFKSHFSTCSGMTQKKTAAQIVLFLSTIPIAVIGNIFRVFVTALIVYTTGANVTDEPMHSIMGALVFVVAFILLFIFGAILRRLFK